MQLQIHRQRQVQIPDAPFEPIATLEFPITDTQRREVLNSCTKDELFKEMTARGYRLQSWADMIRAAVFAFMFFGVPAYFLVADRCAGSHSAVCRLLGW